MEAETKTITIKGTRGTAVVFPAGQWGYAISYALGGRMGTTSEETLAAAIAYAAAEANGGSGYAAARATEAASEEA
jgi:putative hemolysin